MCDKSHMVTHLLSAWRGGDVGAGEKVITMVYSELKKVASAYLRRENGSTLQTTDLVNEAYMRIFPSKSIVFEDRAHFFGVSARAMRQILVEHKRKKTALRRAGARFGVTLEDVHGEENDKELDLLRLDDALNQLESFDSRKAHLVELRFFTGLTIEETATVLDISISTVKREWLLARAWLYNQLTN